MKRFTLQNIYNTPKGVQPPLSYTGQQARLQDDRSLVPSVSMQVFTVSKIPTLTYNWGYIVVIKNAIILNTTSATSGAGTSYPSGAHDFTPSFLQGLCCSIFHFLCCILQIVASPFFPIFFWSLCSRLFFGMWILITPLASSNSSQTLYHVVTK